MKHKLILLPVFTYVFLGMVLMIIIGIFNPFENKDWGKLGNGYEIAYDANSDLVLGGSRNNRIVPGPIIIYLFNDKYITVKEKPRMKIDSIFGLSNKYKRFNDLENAFKKIQYFDYWIIDKQIDSVYGPFQKQEFLVKFKELNLPDSLRID